MAHANLGSWQTISGPCFRKSRYKCRRWHQIMAGRFGGNLTVTVRLQWWCTWNAVIKGIGLGINNWQCVKV